MAPRSMRLTRTMAWSNAAIDRARAPLLPPLGARLAALGGSTLLATGSDLATGRPPNVSGAQLVSGASRTAVPGRSRRPVTSSRNTIVAISSTVDPPGATSASTCPRTTRTPSRAFPNATATARRRASGSVMASTSPSGAPSRRRPSRCWAWRSKSGHTRRGALHERSVWLIIS